MRNKSDSRSSWVADLGWLIEVNDVSRFPAKCFSRSKFEKFEYGNPCRFSYEEDNGTSSTVNEKTRFGTKVALAHNIAC